MDAFSASAVYFQVMAQIAFWAYLPKMKSYYEFIIGKSIFTIYEVLSDSDRRFKLYSSLG